MPRSLTQRESAKITLSPSGDQAATAFSTYREEQLDKPLQVLAAVSPGYPADLKSRGVRGFATVDFVIDATGRVRVAAVTDASEPEFGAAARAAIPQWRIAGLSTQAMVDRTFRFGAADLAKLASPVPAKPDSPESLPAF